MKRQAGKQVETSLTERQKLDRTKEKMATAFANSCCNVKDDPEEAAYYYGRFIKYAGLYGGHINKIFKEAHKPLVNEAVQCELACKAIGRTVDDVNRLASTIERKLDKPAPMAVAV